MRHRRCWLPTNLMHVSHHQLVNKKVILKLVSVEFPNFWIWKKFHSLQIATKRVLEAADLEENLELGQVETAVE